MYFFITQKQTQDKHQQSCDTLEHNYLDYFKAHPYTPKQAVFIPISNHLDNANQLLKKLKPALILFTGGNNLNPKDLNLTAEMDDLALRRDSIERLLFTHAIKHNIPVLAICRGFQHVNVLAGGKITLFLKNHPTQPHFCLHEDEKFQVNSFHAHGVFLEDLADALKPIVIDEQQSIVEGYIDKTLPTTVLGMQWHPERADTDESLFSLLYKDFLIRAKLIDF